MRVKLEIALLRELRLADSIELTRDSNREIIARASVLNNRFTSHPPNLPQNDHNSSEIKFSRDLNLKFDGTIREEIIRQKVNGTRRGVLRRSVHFFVDPQPHFI